MKINKLLCTAAAVSAFVFPSIANAEVEKAYTLTPVDSATDTSITLYDYDSETKTLNKTHNELTLNKTTYGSGNASTTVDISLPNNKNQQVSINYYTTNPQDRVDVTTETDINGSFVGLENTSIKDFDNKHIISGGAIANNNRNLNSITGLFANNYINDTRALLFIYGGAVSNINYSTIDKITGDFINNHITLPGSYVYSKLGGAIFNGFNSSIGEINGNFVNNYITDYEAFGGAISNMTFFYFDSSFDNNYVKIDKINANFINNGLKGGGKGGAICNYAASSSGVEANAIIGDINGDFINNYITGNSSGRGGAISNWEIGGSYQNLKAEIGNITGDFIGNYIDVTGSAYGGAIDNSNGAEIKDIKGNFIKNYAIGQRWEVKGGAINSQGGNSFINSIEGDFIENSAQTITDSNDEIEITGGAIHLGNATINTLKGDFIRNYVDGAAVNDIFASGGAIHTSGTIGNFDGDFIENHIQVKSEKGKAYATGGAFANEGLLEELKTNFVNNKIESSHFAFGGGLANGGPNFSIGEIKKLESNFIGNKAIADKKQAVGGGLITYNNLLAQKISVEVDGTVLGPYYSPGEDGLAGGLELKNVIAEGNEAESKQNVASGGFAGIVGTGINLNIVQNMQTNSQEEHDATINGLLAEVESGMKEGYIFKSNEDLSVSTSIINSTIINNKVIGKTGANGGAIAYIANEELNTDYFDLNNKTAYYFGDELLGEYYEDLFAENSFGEGSGIEVFLRGKMHIKDTLFQENIAKTSEGFAKGGAIAIVENISIDNCLSSGETNIKDLKTGSNYNYTFDTKEEALNWIQENEDGVTLEEQKKYFSVIKPTANINIENTSFYNNTAISENGTALGGAIYSDADLTITADGQDVTFAGNKTISAGVEDDNAIYLDKNAVVTFDIKNNGIVNMADNINGTDGYGITITGDSTGTFNMLNTIGKANLSLGNVNINMLNNKVDTYELNTLTAVGNSNLYVDVDLANETMDKFTTTGTEVTHNGTINVAGMNLISDAKTDLTKIEFADSSFKDNVTIGFDKVGKGVDNKFQTTAYSPIYAYDVTYDPSGTTGNFVFKGGPSSAGNNLSSYAPSVAAKPIAQNGAQNVQLDSYTEAFRNMDMFMLMPENERLAYKYRNKYASLTDDLVYDPTMSSYQNNTAWFRPYTTFEDVPLKNGPKVSNVSYGTYFGYDSALTELGKGWDGTLGVYAGYNGSHQTFQGNSIYQNGGTLGLIGVAYKGNFFTGWTLNMGASAGSTSTIQGSDNFTSLMGGISTKNGYNFEFADGKFILQPSVLLSYSLVNTFDYTNAAGVRMKSDPLHTLQIEPSIKVIGNLGSWQPYANVSMVWNILNETKVTANDVQLPDVSVKPYVKYGVGLQKKWADKFTAFGQCYVTNGGRNGVGLQAGLRIALGDETSKPKAAWLNPKKKDTTIVLDGKVK